MRRIVEASPHTRGWTPGVADQGGVQRGFPAHAWMDREPAQRAWRPARLPRTRGDGPTLLRLHADRALASPHTRGWTRSGKCRLELRLGFPAHAGMDLPSPWLPRSRRRLPRTRGDGPLRGKGRSGGAAASPHTRGWTVGHRELLGSSGGFPAHAGMDPGAGRGARRCLRLPRTRGDGPRAITSDRVMLAASPHTRGWTPCRAGAGSIGPGFPAHAGMDPSGRRRRDGRARLPRTRGDGPVAANGGIKAALASPHTRGWTPGDHACRCPDCGFLAHAGMDRGIHPRVGARTRLPRTRGDGPRARSTSRHPSWASPHTRGWTGTSTAHVPRAEGFPAHAGMDPLTSTRSTRSARLPRTRGDGPRAAGVDARDAACTTASALR